MLYVHLTSIRPLSFDFIFLDSRARFSIIFAQKKQMATEFFLSDGIKEIIYQRFGQLL